MMEEHYLSKTACPEESQKKIYSEQGNRLYRWRPREARSILRKVLQQETEKARNVILALKSGTVVPLEQHLSYASYAADILSSHSKKLSLKITTCTSSGADKVIETGCQLPNSILSQQDVLARLALYLLQTRGRLRKIENDADCKMLDIGVNLYMSERHEMRREKRDFLDFNQELFKATSVRSFSCSMDSEWCARILQVLAPRLEWATVDNVGPEHMHILSTMPRLRRLRLWLANDNFAWDDYGPFQWDDEGRFNVANNDPKDPTRPYWFKELPADSSAGLIRLKADMPRQVILPLVVQHRQTLRELTLDVALPPQQGDEISDWQRQWGWNCPDLPQRLAELLDRFSFPALRLFVLFRISSHSEEGHFICSRQLRAVRRVFGPSVTVICNKCG